MANKTLNVKIRTKARFDTQSHRTQRHANFLSMVSSQFGATMLTEDFHGSFTDRGMIEKITQVKQIRGLTLSSQRLQELERKIHQHALRLSSGNISYAYLIANKPYSQANPRPPLPAYILNDHSLDPTTPLSYYGKQFKKSWVIKTVYRSRKEANLIIENKARYSIYIRATELGKSKQIPRPIFSKLLEYARKNL